MSELEASLPSPPQGWIKVYATADGTVEDWTNPRRIHLHKKMPSGITQCCASVTAGGIVEDPDKKLFFLTSDRIIPEDAAQCEQHIDTNDGTCGLIGHVKHTSRPLRYTLITVSDTVADQKTVEEARDHFRVAVSGHMSFRAALHPLFIKRQFRKSNMTILARTRHNEIVKGQLTFFPIRDVCPWYLGLGKFMIGRFDPSPALEQVDVGTWIYTKRSNASIEDPLIKEMLEREVHGPYPPEIFRYHPHENPLDNTNNPLAIIGHVVEIRDRSENPNGPVYVAIQGAYEVLTEIFMQRGRLNNPGGKPPVAPVFTPLSNSAIF